jgi:hypothetical protein
MDKEELRPMILELMQELAMSSLVCPFHTHTQTDGGQLDASKSILNSPQTTIASVSGSLSSGGLTGLTTADSIILTNLQTAVNALLTAQKNIGLIKSS